MEKTKEQRLKEIVTSHIYASNEGNKMLPLNLYNFYTVEDYMTLSEEEKSHCILVNDNEKLKVILGKVAEAQCKLEGYDIPEHGMTIESECKEDRDFRDNTPDSQEVDEEKEEFGTGDPDFVNPDANDKGTEEETI